MYDQWLYEYDIKKSEELLPTNRYDMQLIPRDSCIANYIVSTAQVLHGTYWCIKINSKHTSKCVMKQRVSRVMVELNSMFYV